MNLNLVNVRRYFDPRWAVALVILLLVACLLFAVVVLVPRWQQRAGLVAQLATTEAVLDDESQGQQAEAEQARRQMELAGLNFDQQANLFLTEAEAALFLDELVGSAANFGVSIVALQAVTVPQALTSDGQKPVYDVRQFHLVAEGPIAQLTDFASSMEATAVPSIVLQNLRISQGEVGLPDLLSVDLRLYTSPYAGAVPENTPAPPAASATPMPEMVTATAVAAPPTPALTDLLNQLDNAWRFQDWPEVIVLVQMVRQADPTYPEMLDKLYAAHVNYAYRLAELGDLTAAAAQFEQAIALIPGRGEAEAGLQSLLPPTPTATPQITIHIVQRGDTLYSIARRYGSTVDAVKAANGLTSNNITPGQQLIIP